MYVREKVYHSYFNYLLLIIIILIIHINLDVVANYMINLLLYV